MGYTHDFNFTKGVGKFSKEVLEDIKRIAYDYKDIIQYGGTNDNPPLINEDVICFNGVGENAYETFYLAPDAVEYNFCKTARKPYDLPACEILLVLKHQYGENFSLESDGFYVSKEEFEGKKLDGNWDAALKNVREKFGYVYDLIPRTKNSYGNIYYFFDVENPAENIKVGA